MWTGGTGRDWLGALIGLGLYVGILGLLTEGVWALLWKTTRKRLSHAVGVPFCAVLAAAGVWAILSAHREYAPTLDDVLVVAALISFAAAATLLPLMGVMSQRAVCGAAGVALASGIAAVAASGQVFLFHPDRAKAVTAASVAWVGIAAVVGLAGWGFQTSPLPKTRRLGLSLALIALPLVAMHVLLIGSPAPHERRGSNIVLIVLDTLRADYCSAYGGPVATPALDAMAHRGTIFNRSYALGPWTPPSMTGMFASTYPLGLSPGPTREAWLDEVWRYALRAEDRPLAELLAAQGYETCALIANLMLRDMRGMLRGFDTNCFSHPMIWRQRGLFGYFPFLQSTLAARLPCLVDKRYNDTTADLTRYALAYIRRHTTDSFFLWVHYIDPHAPYDPPEAYRTMTGPWRAFAPEMDTTSWFEDGVHEKPLADFDERDRPYVRSLYKGEIRYVDDAVGRIVAELARLNLGAHTYVCVTSDHGEELWDHGGWGHGQTVYDELMHVPLIITGPDVRPLAVDEPVSAIDLMPTLADLAGVAPAASWHGTSLAPVLRGERPTPPSRACFGRGTGFRVQTEPLEMVVLDDHKLIQGTSSGKMELYDLLQDPREQVDLADQHPELIERPAALMNEWRAAYPSTFEEFFGGEQPTQDRHEMMQQLRAIGYL